jgi:glycosyltransferase involved in cell wall biosynthesis
MPNHVAIAIIVWKKLSRRSELLAQALNAELWFFKDNLPYARAFAKTLLRSIREKPRVMVVQLPQGPVLLEAYLLKKLTGCKVVADVHTGFMVSTDWKGLLLNAPFVKLLPTADVVVAHNETQLDLIPQKVRKKTIVVFDPWSLIGEQGVGSQGGQERYIVFPASFAPDEPLEEVIGAINTFKINVKMYVTGNWKRNPNIKKHESNRIAFTGFLPNEEYSRLLSNAAAIVTGTKREYTALMSGWEAVAYGKPLAVTATRTLKDLFGDYAIFYDYRSSQSIAEAINKTLDSKPNTAAQEKLKQKTKKSLEQLKQRIQQLN